MAEDGVAAKKKRTLLEKYDIPINHLSYEYVRKCKDGKELERIVKILRSGEEGFYPPLLKCAEKRLVEIMPESRALLVEEPVLTKSMLSTEHWNQVNSELTDWSSEMKMREEELRNASDSLVTSSNIPQIRSERGAKSPKMDNQSTDLSKKTKSIVPRDYSEWDKFDADKEILKMDLEEEKKKEEVERKQRANQKESVKKSQISRSKLVASGDYSNAEKKFLAGQEKDKGNEYFKAKEYKQAIEHYSASIAIDPSPAAYNNRAMAHLRLEQYLEALRDSNKVLEVEPQNVKALHRRGIAHKHRGSYQNALDDFQKILELEPDNRIASSMAKEMQMKVDSKRKSVRMYISEEDIESGPKIVELPDEPYVDEPCIQDSSMKYNTSWPPPPDRRIKCNEFGLPKVMCNCSGVPDWVRKPPPKCLICKEIKEKRKAEEKQKRLAESAVKRSHESEDSESEEESVCEHSSVSETIVSPTASEKGLMETQVVREDAPSRQVERGGGDSVSREEASVSNEPTSKGTAPSPPKVKGARKTEARRVLPPEIKPVKVQVASKYTTKTVVKGEEEAGPGVQGIQELTLQEGLSKITTPFDFITAMLSVPKGSDAAEYAPILQRVDPADLYSLIGNKLDDAMLSCILECLEKCFSNNCLFVLKYLENLSTLPRFGLVILFMDSTRKEVVSRLFDLLESQGYAPSDHLRKQYNIVKK